MTREIEIKSQNINKAENITEVPYYKELKSQRTQGDDKQKWEKPLIKYD